jgi:hypothetical protein
MASEARAQGWLIGLSVGLAATAAVAAASGLYIRARVSSMDSQLGTALARLHELEVAKATAAAPAEASVRAEEAARGADALALLNRLQAELGADDPGDDDERPAAAAGEPGLRRIATELYEDMALLADASADPQARLAAARRLAEARMPRVRLAGARALLELAPDEGIALVDDILARAGDDRRSQRMAAASIALLRDVPGDPVDAKLYALFEGDNGLYRQTAARVLEQRGDASAMRAIVAAAAPALQNDDGGVRARTVAQLGRIGSPSTIPALTPLLADSNSEVRLRTVESLARTDDASVAVLITPLLDDPVAEVRSTAARSLARLRNPPQSDGGPDLGRMRLFLGGGR